jgi:hypothetical protein
MSADDASNTSFNNGRISFYLSDSIFLTNSRLLVLAQSSLKVGGR